jgi:hypothetical protein
LGQWDVLHLQGELKMVAHGTEGMNSTAWRSNGCGNYRGFSGQTEGKQTRVPEARIPQQVKQLPT